MDPIDKILIRTGILILGSIFGYTCVKTPDSIHELAKAVKNQTTMNAGLVPLPPQGAKK